LHLCAADQPVGAGSSAVILGRHSRPCRHDRAVLAAGAGSAAVDRCRENQGMISPLTGIRACVFDAYGTLFDFAAAARGCRDELGARIDVLTSLWRDKQLQYTWLRAVQDRHVDFWKVTGDALDFALETLAIEKPSLCDQLMRLYLTLDAFPEVPDVLARLKR